MSSSPRSSTTTRSRSGCTRTSNGAAPGEATSYDGSIPARDSIGPQANTEDPSADPPSCCWACARSGRRSAARDGLWTSDIVPRGHEVIRKPKLRPRSFRADGVRSGNRVRRRVHGGPRASQHGSLVPTPPRRARIRGSVHAPRGSASVWWIGTTLRELSEPSLHSERWKPHDARRRERGA